MFYRFVLCLKFSDKALHANGFTFLLRIFFLICDHKGASSSKLFLPRKCVRKGSGLDPSDKLVRSISSHLIGLGVSSCTTSAFSFSPDLQLNG